MITLAVKQREELGKRAKNVHKEGLIPGVLYGPTIQPQAVSVRYSDFEKTYEKAGETTLISLDMEGAKDPAAEKSVVLIRDAKTNPVTRAFMHVDFYQLPLDKPIEIAVPIEMEGEAPAVHELGGTLVQNLHEVQVRALPQNLIHGLTIDVSGLKTYEDAITVANLAIPENVEVLDEPETVVAFVEEMQEEEEEEVVEEAAEDEAIESIKTEGEEKREQEEAEEAEENQSE